MEQFDKTNIKRQLKKAAEEYPYERVKSVNNCGRINSHIGSEIGELPFVDAAYLFEVVIYGIEGKSDGHMWVEANTSQGNYVVDGAIDQYCGEETDVTLPEQPPLLVKEIGKLSIDYDRRGIIYKC